MTGQLQIDVYTADGTDFVRTLRLTAEQCEIVAEWVILCDDARVRDAPRTADIIPN